MTGPQRALMRLLESAFGEDSTGHAFVQSALREARRTALPVEPEALLDFVRAHLMAPLADELGPRMVSALIDDLAAELAKERSATPPHGALASPASHPSHPAPGIAYAPTEPPKSSNARPRSSVLLCNGDRFSRAALARSLVSASFDVTAAESPLDVMSLHATVDVAILDMQIGEVAAVLGALMTKQPDLRLIAVTNDPASAETLLKAAAVRHYRIAPKSMRAPELGVLIKRLVAA